MKKYLIIIAILFSAFGYSQVIGADMLNMGVKTTAEMNAITVGQGLQKGSFVYNSSTESIHTYDGTNWNDMGGVGSVGADNQQLSFLGTTLALEDGGTPIDLDDAFATNAQLTSGLNGKDGSETKINAGSNVTISGEGTIGNPYVIGATTSGGSTYTAGTGLTESPTGTFNVNETYLNGVYLPLSGGVMSGDIDFESNGNVYDISYLSATSASISTLNGTSAILTGDLELTGGSISVYGSGIFDRISYRETDIEPIGSEGKTYWDDSENRLKAYDGTSWKAFLLDGDVTGGSTSLTGYHSINEITSDITAAYSNQVTGSGYRVINEVKGTTDIDVTINNLRSSLVNENYSFVSNSSGSVLELLEGSASFVGKGQEGNNAVRVTDYGSANLLEISDGVFRVDGDFEWFTYAQNLILQGTQGSGTGNGATGGTHPGMTNSGTIPTYVIADDGSSAFDFNRYEVTINLASNGLSVGDTIQITADSITGGTSPNIYVNINSTSNTQIATINASQLSDTGVIPSGATELSIWFLPNFNSTNNTTATFTNVRVTKL